MRRFYSTYSAILVCLALTACSYRIGGYHPSTGNIEKLRNLGAEPEAIALGSFTSAPGVRTRFVCREGRKVMAPYFRSFDQYIKRAVEKELRGADLLSEESPVALTAVVQKVDFETDVPVRTRLSTLTGGRWMIHAEFKTNKGETFSVRHAFPFKTHYRDTWDDRDTCEAVAKAFVPAVQSFLNEMYGAPGFKAALGIPLPPPPAEPTPSATPKNESKVSGSGEPEFEFKPRSL